MPTPTYGHLYTCIHSYTQVLQQDPRDEETLGLAGCSQLFWLLEPLLPSSQTVTKSVSL